MKKSIFKRGLSGFLAFVLCVTGLLGIGATTAYAAGGTEAEAVMISFPRDGDANYSADWGRSAKSFMNGWGLKEGNHFTVYGNSDRRSFYNGNVVHSDNERVRTIFQVIYVHGVSARTPFHFCGRTLAEHR